MVVSLLSVKEIEVELWTVLWSPPLNFDDHKVLVSFSALSIVQYESFAACVFETWPRPDYTRLY